VSAQDGYKKGTKHYRNGYEKGTNGIEKNFTWQKSVHFCSFDERFCRYQNPPRSSLLSVPDVVFDGLQMMRVYFCFKLLKVEILAAAALSIYAGSLADLG